METAIPPRKIIHPNIYLFIYNLLKTIIYDEDKPKRLEQNIKEKRSKKINLFITIINTKMKHKNDKLLSDEKKKLKFNELTTEYSVENFKNIILFLEQQNPIYIGDILDNILIQICGFSMKIDPYETINENIFDKEEKNRDVDLVNLSKFINAEVFKDQNMKKYLYPNYPFLYFLFYSYKTKFNIINKNNKEKYNNNDIMKYIFNYYIDDVNNYFIDNISKKVNDCLSKKIKNLSPSIFFNIHYLAEWLEKKFNDCIKFQNENKNEDSSNTKTPSEYEDILEYFYYTLFVYYKIITDFKKYSQSNKNEKNQIVNIPYSYDLENGFLNVFYALMVTSPIKVIKNIKHVSFCQNNLNDVGLFEIGKVFLFNTEIETLNYNKNLLRAYYFSYLTFTQRIFENHSIKKISISNNIYLKEDIDILLCEIIKHFKSLKVINITNNELKSGIKNFCIELKKLYRLNKCEIEELNFNKCALDDESIFELAELLKCRQCKLKSINLDKSNLKDSPKIFTCIKKNKSLVKLYVSKCQINNSMIKIINKNISLHKKLESIDLAKNCIKSSDQLTRLISRTKLIKDEKHTKIINSYEHLLFLDISQNPIDYLQNKFNENIIDLIQLSNLKILDCSKIIFGANPNLYVTNPKDKHQSSYNEKVKSNFIPFVENNNTISLNLDNNINFINNNIKENTELLGKGEFFEYNVKWQKFEKEKNNSIDDNLDMKGEMKKFIEIEKNKENNNNIIINGDNENEDKTEILKDFSKKILNLNKSRNILKSLEKKKDKQICKLII